MPVSQPYFKPPFLPPNTLVGAGLNVRVLFSYFLGPFEKETVFPSSFEEKFIFLGCFKEESTFSGRFEKKF